jgi:hypothetical protein
LQRILRERGRQLESLAAIWIVALIVGSLQPRRPSREILSLVHRPFHFVAFALTALLLWSSFTVANRAFLAAMFRPAKVWIDAFLATIALGGAIEVLQYLINRDRIEWWDIRDDALGAATAILVVHLARAAVSLKKST